MNYIVCLFLLLSFSSVTAEIKPFDPVIPTKLAPDYDNELRAHLVKAQENLDALIIEIGQAKTTVSPALHLKFKQALDALQVKEILVNNFVGTPSLKSPIVRTKLLDLLKRESITTGDLTALQTLVTVEKRKQGGRSAL